MNDEAGFSTLEIHLVIIFFYKYI